MSYATSSDTAPTLSNENAIDAVAPAVTFVINTQGPGPFTFNLNFGGSSLPRVIKFTVNANGDSRPAKSRQRSVPKRSSTAERTVVTRKFLATPQKSATATESEVPETPPGMLASCMPPRKKIRTESQEVDPGSSQQSSLADASDTEGDVTDFHNNEPVAVFSPMCKLVTPSRKRKLDCMEQETGMNGEEAQGAWQPEFKRSSRM